MEKVFGYIRVSTETQAEKGYGKDVQEAAIHEFCKKNKLEVVKIFKDLGISGTLFPRDGITELFSALSKGEIKRVIVMNTSRLWRADNSKVMIKRQLMKDSAMLTSIEQPTYSIYDKDPNDFLLNGMMELLDQYDRLNINMKLANGRRQKAKGGIKSCGNPPIGYQWKHEGVKKPIIVVDNDKVEVVREIFKSYLELKSIRKVQHYLFELGYKTHHGKDFSAMARRNILTNRFYLGEVKHSDLIVKGQHEPLINKISFGKVQSLLKRNQRKGA
ncbi:recombinase family protein [Bacillus zhangzhouensis]|uniref:recombinase family protein n=1 Tax=Bacillus zhangzhouensis TaxID=1178540 RepID=UPI0020BE99BA|nr:recombinase family protein [Bacillus zhangzhouensis]